MRRLFLLSIAATCIMTNAFAQPRPAADFNLKNAVNGQSVALSDFKTQKGVILTFVTNACPVASAYQARIQALHTKYAGLGFPVVAIDPIDGIAAMKKRATDLKYTYPLLHDASEQVTAKYHVKLNAHTFILLNTPAGFTIAYEGAIDDDYSGDNITARYVENAVNALLNKQPVKVTKTKVMGCPMHGHH